MPLNQPEISHATCVQSTRNSHEMQPIRSYDTVLRTGIAVPCAWQTDSEPYAARLVRGADPSLAPMPAAELGPVGGEGGLRQRDTRPARR